MLQALAATPLKEHVITVGDLYPFMIAGGVLLGVVIVLGLLAWFLSQIDFSH